MGLTNDDWTTLSRVLIDRVEAVNRENLEEIKTALKLHSEQSDARHADHEKRIGELESRWKKLVFGWTFLVAAVTAGVQYTYETYIKPSIGR